MPAITVLVGKHRRSISFFRLSSRPGVAGTWTVVAIWRSTAETLFLLLAEQTTTPPRTGCSMFILMGRWVGAGMVVHARLEYPYSVGARVRLRHVPATGKGFLTLCLCISERRACWDGPRLRGTSGLLWREGLLLWETDSMG